MGFYVLPFLKLGKGSSKIDDIMMCSLGFLEQ